MEPPTLTFLFLPVHAQTTVTNQATSQGFDFMSFLPLVAVMVFMYLFFFRAQQKKEKTQKELLAKLSRGDRVLTTFGMLATVAKVANDQEVILEIAPGVQASFLKTVVATVVGKKGLSDVQPPASEKPTSKESKFAPRSSNRSANRPNTPSGSRSGNRFGSRPGGGKGQPHTRTSNQKPSTSNMNPSQPPASSSDSP